MEQLLTPFPLDPVDPADPATSSKPGIFIERVVTFDPGGHSRCIFLLIFFDPSHMECLLLDHLG